MKSKEYKSKCTLKIDQTAYAVLLNDTRRMEKQEYQIYRYDFLSKHSCVLLTRRVKTGKFVDWLEIQILAGHLRIQEGAFLFDVQNYGRIVVFEHFVLVGFDELVALVVAVTPSNRGFQTRHTCESTGRVQRHAPRQGPTDFRTKHIATGFRSPYKRK